MSAEATPNASEPKDPYAMTGELIHALAREPKYRKRILSLIKEAAPETVIPELDVETDLLKSVEDRIKPREEEIKKTNDRLSTLEQQLHRERWRLQHNLNDADLVEIETIAKEAQIGKADAALELWKHRQAVSVRSGSRRPADGSVEYMKSITATSPRDSKRLKDLAFTEATRILHEGV